MKCIICNKETMSGVFVHTPSKTVMCIKCRQAEEADKRNEELKQKWEDKN